LKIKCVKDRRLAVVLMVLYVLAGCGEGGGDTGKIQPPPVKSQSAVQVNVVEVHKADIFHPVVATGNILPQRDANVGSKIAGKLQKLYVDEGDEVRGGYILFVIEKDDLVLAQKGARAELDMAKAALTEAGLSLENMEREKMRIARLYEKKAIAQQKYDDSQTAHALAMSRVDLADAQLARARVNLALMDQRLQDAVVRAPFSGSIAKKIMREAELVAPNMPVITLMNIDHVKVEVEIPEIQARSMRRGTPAAVTIDALPQKEFQGKISRINGNVNPMSRTFKLEIDIPNSDHSIKAGMFARITIETDVVRDVMVIPPKALITDDRGHYGVFIVKDNRAVLKKVVTGTASEHLIEVREGLNRGDKVIVAGNFGLEDNAMVVPRVVTY